MTAGLIVQPMSQWLLRSKEGTTAVDGISSTLPYSFDDLPIVPVSNVDDPATYANAFDGDWPAESNQDGLTVRNDWAQGISFASPYATYFQTAQGGGVLWKTDKWMHEGPSAVVTNMTGFYNAPSTYLPRMLLVFPEHAVAVTLLEQTRTSPFDTGSHKFAKIDLNSESYLSTIATLRYDIPLGTSRRRVSAWCSNREDGVIYSVEVEQTFDSMQAVTNEKHYVMATTLNGTRTTLADYVAIPYPSVQKLPYGISYDYIEGKILLCTRSWPNRGTLTNPTSPATDQIEAISKNGVNLGALVSWTPPTEETFAGSGVYLHAQQPAFAWTHGQANVMYLWRAPEPSIGAGANDNLRQFKLDGTDEDVIVETGWHSSMFGRAEISYSSSGRHSYCLGRGMRAPWEL